MATSSAGGPTRSPTATPRSPPSSAGRRAATRAQARRLPDSYWLAEPPEWQLANARQIALAEARIGPPVASVHAEPDPGSGATRLSVFAPDRAGAVLPHRRRARRGRASVVDARIHTTRDGMALDNLLVTDARGHGYADARHRARLVEAVTRALARANRSRRRRRPCRAARKRSPSRHRC